MSIFLLLLLETKIYWHHPCLRQGLYVLYKDLIHTNITEFDKIEGNTLLENPNLETRALGRPAFEHKCIPRGSTPYY